MKIALIQQHATDDKAINIQRGLDNIDTAAANGAKCAMFAELAFTRFFPQYHADTSNRIESEFIPGTTSNLFCEKAKNIIWWSSQIYLSKMEMIPMILHRS